jgi:hemerythrin
MFGQQEAASMSPLTEFNRASNAATDREHEVQLGLLQALCSASRENRDAATVAEILAQLIAYSEAHFMSEELLMRLNSHDDYEDHADAHLRILEVLQMLADDHTAGGMPLLAGKVEAARDIVEEHIATRDRRLAENVSSFGVCGASHGEQIGPLDQDRPLPSAQ